MFAISEGSCCATLSLTNRTLAVSGIASDGTTVEMKLRSLVALVMSLQASVQERFQLSPKRRVASLLENQNRV